MKYPMAAAIMFLILGFLTMNYTARKAEKHRAPTAEPQAAPTASASLSPTNTPSRRP